MKSTSSGVIGAPSEKRASRVEMEGDGAAVLGHLHGLGDQAVERERLVEAARHQALVDVVAQVAGRRRP